MKIKSLHYLLLAPLLAAPVLAAAKVTEEDFVAKTTQNMLNLCTASPQDSHYREAVNFCQGYLLGAYYFQVAQAADKPDLLMVCLPKPEPTRNQAIEMFIAWAKSHPQYLNEMPVETEFRFLTEKWPCKK